MSIIAVIFLLTQTLGMCSGFLGSPNSLGLLAEKEKFHMGLGTKAVRVSLKATTDITKDKMTEYFEAMTNISTSYKALPYLAIGTTLAIKYRSAILPGTNYLTSAKDLYMHLYTFMDAGKDLPPLSKCSAEYFLFDTSVILEGKTLLQDQVEKLVGPLTEAEVKADAAKLLSLERFISSFNSIGASWFTQIQSIVSEMDILDGLEFPQSMKGRLETLSCLAGQGHEFETVTVISSTPGKKGLSIELDVGYPTALKEMIRLMPIPYSGVGIKGETENIIFAREVGSTIVKLYNCSNDLIYVNNKAPTCSELPLPEGCKTGLVANDMEKAIKRCPFTYVTAPMAVRLMDDGILVLGDGLTVTVGTKTIYQATPFLIHSNSEVKIGHKDHELIFPALVTATAEKIVSSGLTSSQIIEMKKAAYWDTLFTTFDFGTYLSGLSLGIEGILVPLVLISICLGVRNKVAQRKSLKKLSKETRKRNLRESRALLRESRF